MAADEGVMVPPVTIKVGSEEMVIRRARAGDVGDIIALLIGGSVAGRVDTLNAEAMPAYLAAFEIIDADPDELLYVVEHAGRVVSTFQITFCQTLVNRGRVRATLESVHVCEEMRGKGIGALMVRHAVEVSRARGAGVVQLTSNKKRVDAHRFYERLGFTKSHDGFKLEF